MRKPGAFDLKVAAARAMGLAPKLIELPARDGVDEEQKR
jgi:hypothetical protein